MMPELSGEFKYLLFCLDCVAAAIKNDCVVIAGNPLLVLNISYFKLSWV